MCQLDDVRRACRCPVSVAVLSATALFGQVSQPGTLQIMPDFNRTHSVADVVHLGDNPNDTRFIPPRPSGATLTKTFQVNASQLGGTGEIALLIDQYQADNEIPTQRSFVTLNGVFLNYLTRNSFIQDLSGATSIPVLTERFSVRALLRTGTNTVTIQAGDVHNPGDTLDDFCITNIRLTGVVSTQPEISVAPMDVRIGWSPLTPEPRSKRITIRNNGRATLTGSILAPREPFSLTGSTSFSIEPGRSIPVIVNFRPSEFRLGVPALFSGGLEIQSNDPDRGTVTVGVIGFVYDKQSPDKPPFGNFYYRECDYGAPRSEQILDACRDSNNDFEIDPVWRDGNTTVISTGTRCGSQRVHRQAEAAFRNAFQRIASDGFLRSQVLECGGVFAQRYVGHFSANGISDHSWAIAVDINPSTNKQGHPGRDENCQYPGCPGIPSAENINLWFHSFQPAGFFWGVNYNRLAQSDPMHFELRQPITH